MELISRFWIPALLKVYFSFFESYVNQFPNGVPKQKAYRTGITQSSLVVQREYSIECRWSGVCFLIDLAGAQPRRLSVLTESVS